MSLLQEFRQFALKGNVIDLAVGVIIGAAFQKIVDSAVGDLIMPLVGRVVGNVDFHNVYLPLSTKVPLGRTLEEAKAMGAVLPVGSFLTVALNFVFLALAVFLLVKGINAARHAFEHEERAQAAPPAPPAPSAEEALLREIRDLLARRTGNEPPKLGS